MMYRFGSLLALLTVVLQASQPLFAVVLPMEPEATRMAVMHRAPEHSK